MKLLWIALAMALPGAANASTFIGNGGNAGDVEIQVTTRQLREVYSRLADWEPKKERNLCECTPDFENHAICESLKALSKPQSQFCAETLIKKARELEQLLQGPDAVRFHWTHENVDVQEGRGRRAADAVANRQTREVTINFERFMEMKAYERVFLLTHELMHFTDMNGKPFTDEGAIGPFEKNEGSRDLINAMSSATALEAAEGYLLVKYKRTLNRPQGWKRNWLSLDLGTSNVERAPGGTYTQESFTRSEGRYERYFGAFPLGVVLTYKGQTASSKVKGSISLKEDIASYGAGISYKWFPFQDPLTFFGQTHFVFNAIGEYNSAKISIEESGIGLKDEANFWTGSFGANYRIPAFWNFWLYLGASYELGSYQYSNLKVKYDTNKTSTYIGASYAF